MDVILVPQVTGENQEHIETDIEMITHAKRPGETPTIKTTKKVKKSDEKEPRLLKMLIDELCSGACHSPAIAGRTTSANIGLGMPPYARLFHAITKAEEESESANRAVISAYFNFGKAVEDRFCHFRQSNPKSTAQALVNEEIRNELPKPINEALLRKRKEQALKIYTFFIDIGEDKIQRIKSFTAGTIARLSHEDVDYVLAELAKKR
jgi:hypothetical protein